MKKYLIGDTHFDDKNMILMERHNFQTVTEMNSLIISNWNKTVSPKDTVLFLGDFTSSKDPDRIKNLFDILNGNIIFITGNHDDYVKNLIINNPNDFPRVEIVKYDIILDDFWIFSHEPKFVSLSSPYANIFAHVHLNPMYKTVSARHYCVSAERINYTPIDFEDAKNAVLTEALK